MAAEARKQLAALFYESGLLWKSVCIEGSFNTHDQNDPNIVPSHLGLLKPPHNYI